MVRIGAGPPDLSSKFCRRGPYGTGRSGSHGLPVRVPRCWIVNQCHEVEVVQFAAGAFESRRFFEEDEAIRSAVLPAFDRSFAAILG